MADGETGPADGPARIRRLGRFGLLRWLLPLVLLAPYGLVLGVCWLFAVLTVPLRFGVWFGAGLTPLIRGLAGLHRRYAGQALGRVIERPYQPVAGRLRERVDQRRRDPATWRDGVWLLVNGLVGLALTGIALAILAVVVTALAFPVIWQFVPAGSQLDLGFVTVDAQHTATNLGIAVALIAVVGWILFAPPVLRLDARLAGWLLRPGAAYRLAERVEQLTESRADTVDSQAAELRRIERDLHDGAQARLVALGMSLGLAERLLAADPQGAAKLLAEARESTGAALSELRDLVRGIHPPVLADRGLDGALRALALTSAVPTDVRTELPGRLSAPVEAAAYFAVSELLTNTGKHSGATRAWIEARHDAGRLSLVVGDDGRGGAAGHAGGGLRGLERRLAAFDGILDLHSPPGGPTVMRMELPCESFSPKT